MRKECGAEAGIFHGDLSVNPPCGTRSEMGFENLLKLHSCPSVSTLKALHKFSDPLAPFTSLTLPHKQFCLQVADA